MLALTKERLQKAEAVTLVKISGVKVGEIEDIRNAIYPQGVQLEVAKNSLLKLALAEAGITVPTELLDQPLGLLYGYQDPVSAAKVAQPFVKEIEAFEVVGGIVGGQFVSSAQVAALANLPGVDQLRAQLVGTLQAPISGFVNVLAGNIRGLVNVLTAVKDSKATA